MGKIKIGLKGSNECTIINFSLNIFTMIHKQDIRKRKYKIHKTCLIFGEWGENKHRRAQYITIICSTQPC